MDGTCAVLDEQNVIKGILGKTEFDWNNVSKYYKTVNIYKFSKEFSTTKYIPFLNAYTEAVGNNEYYENVLRVISRVTADDSDIMKQSVRTNMERHLLEVMCDETANVIPSIFNQALMELGATVCLPNGVPHCEICPWKEFCEAKKQDKIMELPVKKKKKERRVEEKTVLILKDGSQLALHKRAKKGLLAGMYELPNVEGHLSEEEVLTYLKEEGYEPIRVQKVCDAKHIFSHVEWHMKGYVVFLQAGEYEAEKKGSLKKAEWIFVEPEETKEQYAIPSAFVKYTEYLNLTIGKDVFLG